ncbi:uncharacterized protein EAE98_009779 [Botrytis deweyae]|uniref:Carboxylic ester hydrolase n=1 Tax=Botrytis deweyae TaxID=2478750 RepID=A0ABQ7IAV0_9HELO|nr:uncharacterized protein EAE98_009779 [Botrytis deweyae]KAF7918536.1 hypothetical protein EAE98_009779 [Botrytis deweyae]
MISQALCISLWAISASAFWPGLSNEAHGAQIPVLSPSAESVSATAELPFVDLGYTKHRAISNPNPDLYKFQSIRYAAPPTGDLRFRAPQAPVDNPTGEVEDGRGRKECLQAMVKWADTFPPEPCDDCECCEEDNNYGECHKPCDSGERGKEPPKQLFGGFQPAFNLKNPNLYSEDCLFLDVWTPKAAFDGKQKKPVLVWIYGGAYVFGGKSLYFPGGLMDRAMVNDRGGMIFVAMNYRMGALGFAAGRDIEDKDINAGLLDQQKALQWVQDHIDKFGGDPNQVTIVGLSAGGGSVLHHLTAYGGQKGALFQRAISLSGGWQPITDQTTAESTFREFMTKYNGVSTLADLRDLRKVSEAQMMEANLQQIQNAPPGSFLYNPTAWGDFAPESPAKLLKNGEFLHDVQLILSHVFNEGGQFAKSFEDQGTTVPGFLDLAFPNVTKDEKEWILETYHSGYNDAEDVAMIIGDATFRCHVTYTSDAKSDQVWRQRWNTVHSRSHGGDLLYLFYQPFVPVASIRAARILQDYVVTFVTSGNPTTTVTNPSGFRQPAPYHQYSMDNKVQFFDSGILRFPNVWRGDAESEDLCRVWQQMSCT